MAGRLWTTQLKEAPNAIMFKFGALIGSRRGQSALRGSGLVIAGLVPATPRKVPMLHTDEVPLEELQRRALSAYFDSGGDEMPGEPRVHKIKGKRYVTLWRRGRMLVCYRVRNDGKLKRLVRVPEGL